jgi:catechol 2,3-dioxygenase
MISQKTSTRPYGISPTGFRLPEATHLGAVRLQVSHLARSVEYYRDLLGLRVLSESDGEATLGPQDDGRTLVVLVERPGARPVPRRGTLGLYHFAILLPDRASLARFVRHLSAANAYAGLSDHAVSEAVYLRDPDGLGIEVYADRPRAAWRFSERQLVMTTEPLDVPDLLAAAGAVEWSGMPAGTVIGHVHLHVAELETAAAFYHSALGFDKVVWDYPGALFLSAGGYHHHLGTNTWSSGPPAAEDQVRLLSWDLVVPRAEDAAAAARSLADAGYHVKAEDGRQTFRTTDPWGTALRIIFND